MNPTILHGDCRDTLKTIPDGSVQMCVTSPPYWGLRSYLPKGHPDKHREIGQEPTPEAYVETMVGVFREVKRCLHDSGTLFLNCGDSYFGSSTTGGTNSKEGSAKRLARMFERESDAAACGSDGTPQPDWQCRDCASGNPCDEHRDALLSHIRRTCDHPALAQVAEPLLQIRARMEVLRGHLPNGGSTRPTRKAQSAIATLDSMRSEVRAASLLLAAAESNLRESSPQQSDYFRLLGMLSACRSSLDSFSAGVHRFVHTLGALEGTPDCTVDTVSPCAELASHIQCTSECCSLVVSWLGYIKAQRSTSQALKPKDLCGIPWRLVLALQADGWYWRSCIVWHKRSCMPESVTDRPTNSWEPIFLLAKSQRYFYDSEAVKEKADTEPHNSGYVNGKEYAVGPMDRGGHSQREDPDRVWAAGSPGFRNQRNVWSLSPEPYSEAHFATFPTEIPKRAILAGSRVGDTVLDPFGGSGTTGQVAIELGRKAIMCELNDDYLPLIEKRTLVTPGLQLA